MADIRTLAPFILSFEGGFVKNKFDKGGATNLGVTLKTWLNAGYDKDEDGDIDIDDLTIITPDDATFYILEPLFWNKCWASQITDQSIANMLVDWAWHSGAKTAIKRIQGIVGTKQDGVMGKQTLSAINNAVSAERIFDALKSERISFLKSIVERNQSQERFLKGWLRRVEAIKYGSLTYNDDSVHEF